MTKTVNVGKVFPLERGGTLTDARIAYRSWGAPSSEAILICHALTGSADADDWWQGLFGPSRVFDPQNDYIICMNVLGGCDGSTGPSSEASPEGFPDITIRDMVHAQKAALDQLGVTRLSMVIGGSMGGMQALEWAALYPQFVDTIIPIGVGSTQSAWALGLSETQRSAINSASSPADGLATARMIAMCTYRSAGNFDARFSRQESTDGFAVQSYLRYQGTKLVDRFDAGSYLVLLAAMDSHDLARGRGPGEGVLRHITTPALVVGISSDVLYPIDEARALAGQLPNATLAVLDSPDGHDAFLIDTEQLGEVIARYLEGSRSTGLSTIAGGG